MAEGQRWARGLPYLLWKRPGLPRDWVPVLERHPEGVKGLPGYVWLDMPGKVRSGGEHELEFREGLTPPALGQPRSIRAPRREVARTVHASGSS